MHADFLNVQIDVRGDSIRPYTKPNNKLKYINTGSNHPKCVKMALPKSIEGRLSKLSSSKEIFEEEKQPFEEALTRAGYKGDAAKLTYKEKTAVKEKKRSRTTNWFNPEVTSNVT